VHQELAALGRERDAARAPVEQRRAGAALERADLVRERGLGDEQPLRGARERLRLGDGDQVAQLAQRQRMRSGGGS
jgi:hypothetical protein